MSRQTLTSRTRPAAVAAVGLALAATAVLTGPADSATAAPPASHHTRDYTGDGLTDILTVSDAGRLGLYAGDGRGGVPPSTLVGTGWQGYTVTTPGDFDGDGRDDVVAVSPGGQLYLYAGRGNGAFAGRKQIGHGWQSFPHVFSPGDFDGDGRPDIIGVTATGDLRLYRGTGNGRVGQVTKIGHGWGAFTDVLAGGDFDGDGRADIMATDAQGRLWAYYNRGGNRMSARAQVGRGWSGYSQLSAVGDFTGDGATDLFAQSNGTAYVYPGTGRGTFRPRIVLGTAWQQPEPAPVRDVAPPPADGSFSYEREQLASRLNDLRASRGVRPVVPSDELNARAQAWAKHMAETQQMYHTPNFSAQMAAAGWSYKSELIVRHSNGRRMNTDDVLAYMHNWWVNSPDHYPWMVSPNYTHVGHGYYIGPGGPYAVTVLGGR